jgi:hypothetical protein
MTTQDGLADPPALSRDELVALVSKAHLDSTYGDSALAGKSLARQSKLPKLVAENLGAGFGQWDFFPEATEIVDFASGYVPPTTEEELWTLARSWAADEATGRRTVFVLVGREILQHELRRIDIPKLREFFDEERSSRALALRASLGLAIPEPAAARPGRSPRAAPAKRAAVAKAGGDIPMRMPKPEFKRPQKPPPPPPPKRFQHPKFGEGSLVAQDGTGDDAKLTIKFASGAKTLLARYLTELPD